MFLILAFHGRALELAYHALQINLLRGGQALQPLEPKAWESCRVRFVVLGDGVLGAAGTR